MSTTSLRGPPSDAESTWIVQKYGGTSVGKFLPTIAREIASSYIEKHRLAIVCSARSGQTKALGTTNLLLKAAGEALAAGGSNTPGIASLSNSVASISGPASGGSPARETPVRTSSAFGRKASRSGRQTPVRSESRTGLSLTRSDDSGSIQPTALNNCLDALKVRDSSENRGESSESEVEAVGFDATVDRILADHLAAVREVVSSEELRKQVEEEIIDDCEALRDFLMAAKIIEEISPRSKDVIIGVGERLSCRIVVAAMRDAGIDAELVTLENIVDAALLETCGPGGSRLDMSHDGQLGQDFYDKLAIRLGERLNACTGVPVVTGYFGTVPGSLLAQIGRGYTDLCAALCAVGVGAQELQIWKEVDGVFTADPRKVPTARLIPAITPEEAAELTYYGSEVIHPFTMEQAIKKSVPIRIKNVQNPGGGGTVIFPDTEITGDGERPAGTPGLGAQIPFPPPNGIDNFGKPWGASAAMKNPGDAANGSENDRKLPTAVTIKDDVLVLNVHSNRKTISHGFFARIFSTLDRHGVVVDLISTSEVHVSMAIAASSLPPAGTGPRARVLAKVLAELEPVGTVSILRDMAILSLVGKRMRHMVGVAGKMFTTLAEGNINIEMISQGANEINISCVISESEALKALNLIHYSVLEVSPKPSNMESGSFGRAFF